MNRKHRIRTLKLCTAAGLSPMETDAYLRATRVQAAIDRLRGLKPKRTRSQERKLQRLLLHRSTLRESKLQRIAVHRVLVYREVTDERLRYRNLWTPDTPTEPSI